MPNDNCLENMACPECGHDSEILVAAIMTVSLMDDGTDPYADSTRHHGGTEYDDESPAECPVCNHTGKLGEWNLREDEDE